MNKKKANVETVTVEKSAKIEIWKILMKIQKLKKVDILIVKPKIWQLQYVNS